MNSHLLATKFHIPAWRPTSVPRPRLLQHLNRGLTEYRKLTLVSAPAGYGKTTLIVDWIHLLQENSRVVWISLDGGDNIPARFLGYCLSAFQRVEGAVGQSAQSLLSLPQPPPLQVILDDLLNDLAGIKEQVVLVLDDYHTITNPQIHEALEYFIEHQPAQIHLTLTTREDPPLPLARMRARGQMTEVRAHDLRFTLDEADHFFNQSMCLGYPRETISALEARTEGWAAGLQLAALALQHLPNPQEFIQTFHGTHRYILDYLAEEVLRQQDEEIRSFLFQTAVLDRFNAPLCNAVTGRSNSQSLLARLEQANLFIIPLDNERIWYRYHHLFADYLQTGLTKPEQSLVQEKASHWYEENNLVFEAVRYAFLSGNQELAADVIERVIQKPTAWSGGDVATLVGWIDALPGPLLRSRPTLSLHASRAWYLAGRIELSEKYLDQAEQSLREFQAEDPQTEKLLAISAVYRSSISALRGDLRVAVERASFALNHLPEDELHARARASETLGHAYELSGDLAKASQLLIQASDLAHSTGVSFMTVIARCEAAITQINQGKLHQAEQLCQQAILLAGEKPIPPLGFVGFVLAEIAWERNDISTAEQYLMDAMELSRQGGLVDDLRYEMTALARLKRSTGNLADALSTIEQAHSVTQSFGIARMIMLSGAHVARTQLAFGMMEPVNQWARSYEELRNSRPVEYTREYEEITLARVYLANGEHDQALEVLTPLFEQMKASGNIRTCIETMILLAILRQAQKKPAIAQEWLAKALTLAEPEGFVRLFLDEGPLVAELLPKAHSAAPDFVDQILQAFPGQPAPANRKTLHPANTKLLEPLSEQELRVLKLILAGLSNQEIAEELVISPGTAKWHVHNILQKMGVSNRPQAIARARELGIEP